MVTSMLEKAIEIEGLLRIIRDGNPLPETYILLNIKAAELAEQALCLEERATATETEGTSTETEDFSAETEGAAAVTEESTDFRPSTSDEEEATEDYAPETPTAPTESDNSDEDAPREKQGEEEMDEDKEVEDKDEYTYKKEEIKETTVEQIKEEEPEPADETEAGTMISNADDKMQKEEAPTVKVDFIMATEKASTLPPTVVFNDEEMTPIEQPVKTPASAATPIVDSYLDLDELEYTEEDDIILNLDAATSDPDTYISPIAEPNIAEQVSNVTTEPVASKPETTHSELKEPTFKEPTSTYTRTETKASATEAIASKHKSRLKSAFSLNDRFLYSRELFEGNMKMFDSTLEFIEGIEDYSIIEDYFYSELEWNPENSHVASFMEILRPHFRE